LRETFGPVPGNRLPAVAKTGAKKAELPTPQKGGGGNRGTSTAPVVTAQTAPTVTIAPTGQVTTQNFGPSPAQRQAARAAKQQAQVAKQRVQRVRKVVRSIEAAPKRELHVSADFLSKATPKPVTVAAYKRKAPGSEAPRAKPIQVAAHQRKAPEVKGTKPERIEARQNLKQAKKLVRRTNQPAQITGLHDKAQEEFAAELSKASGIPPKLAGEWVRQESGASAAGVGGEAGEQNELGVGYPAHPTSFSQSPYFNHTTPKKAADATAKWMEGKIGGEYGYQAASSIQGIPALAKSGASEEEIRNYIEGPSEWGTGDIAQSGVTATPGKSNPKAVQKFKAARKTAKELGLKVAKPKESAGVAVPYKAFGQHVQKDLHAVVRSKGFKDDNSTAPITIKGANGGTLIREVQGSSGVASVIDVNKEPEIAARLLLLSAKRNEPVYVLSGYRTPAQAVSVGGFADDPHTKGEAADIGVGSPSIAGAEQVTEAEYNSVGLYRPFGTDHGGSSTENNHVQLLNEGSPSTGASYVEGASVSGSAPSVAGVPTAAITSYAATSGESPALVAKKVKASPKFRAHVLTAHQQIEQNKRKLRTVSEAFEPTEEAASKSSSLHQELQELEKKYSVGAA